MFDTIGTLVGVTTKANMVEKDGRPLRMNKAFMADAIGTVAGACLGTSTVTTYVESASGVAQGGRSGLTAFSVAGPNMPSASIEGRRLLKNERKLR